MVSRLGRISQRIPSAIVHLFVAAIITVLVAWASTPVRPSYASDFRYSAEARVWLDDHGLPWQYGAPVLDGGGWSRGMREVGPIPSSWGMTAQEVRDWRRTERLFQDEPALPDWAAFPSEFAVRPKSRFVWSVASGWPLLALVGHPTENARPPGRFSMYVDRPQGPGPWAIPFRGYLFPAKPIWPGFLINTLVYLPAAWLLLWTPRFVAGRLRAWRGKCPRCSYDLTGLVGIGCPECGWNRARPLPS